MFDIAVINGYHEYPPSANFHIEGKNLGKSILIVTPNSYEYRKLKKQGVDVIYTNNYFPKNHISTKDILKFLMDKGVADVYDFIATEKAYYNSPDKYLIHYAYCYTYAFEQIFKKYSIKKIFQLQGGEVVRRSATFIAKKLEIQTIYSGETFLPNRTTLYQDEYKTLIRPNETENLDKKELENIVNQKVIKKNVIKYKPPMDDYISGEKISKLLTLLLNKNYNILYNYISHIFKKNVVHRFRNLFSSKFFDKFTAEKPFFYFPFNVAAESELYIRNSEFVAQVATVEKLASNLPENHILITKPHPGNEGHLKSEDYKRLKSLKNVKLLKPDINSFDILEKCEGVVIVSSTVGLESYLLQKPTAVIGNWPYTQMGNFITEKDFSKIFHSLLKAKTNQDPLNLIQNIHNNTFPGEIFSTKEQFKLFIKSLLSV